MTSSRPFSPLVGKWLAVGGGVDANELTGMGMLLLVADEARGLDEKEDSFDSGDISNSVLIQWSVSIAANADWLLRIGGLVAEVMARC